MGVNELRFELTFLIAFCGLSLALGIQSYRVNSRAFGNNGFIGSLGELVDALDGTKASSVSFHPVTMEEACLALVGDSLLKG